MPLTFEEAEALEAQKSHYGCGAYTCLSCYPVIYGCEYCGEDFALPIANGEAFECAECGYDGANL